MWHHNSNNNKHEPKSQKRNPPKLTEAESTSDNPRLPHHTAKTKQRTLLEFAAQKSTTKVTRTEYLWNSPHSTAPRAASSVSTVGRGGGLPEDRPELLRGGRRRGRAGAVERQARKRRLLVVVVPMLSAPLVVVDVGVCLSMLLWLLLVPPFEVCASADHRKRRHKVTGGQRTGGRWVMGLV